MKGIDSANSNHEGPANELKHKSNLLKVSCRSYVQFGSLLVIHSDNWTPGLGKPCKGGMHAFENLTKKRAGCKTGCMCT